MQEERLPLFRLFSLRIDISIARQFWRRSRRIIKESVNLLKKRAQKVAQNVAAGVAGIVIPVLWFGMDFQGAASKEVTALQSRQQYLASMAEERCQKPEPAVQEKKKTKR